jgi:hypothetical protein
MKHFHPNPKWPWLGIALFERAKELIEATGKPYVMENVRAARRFVGRSVLHTGAFHLWGNAVPALLPRQLLKGWVSHVYIDKNGKERDGGPGHQVSGEARRQEAAKVAEIPLVLASHIAQTAGALCR